MRGNRSRRREAEEQERIRQEELRRDAEEQTRREQARKKALRQELLSELKKLFEKNFLSADSFFWSSCLALLPQLELKKSVSY